MIKCVVLVAQGPNDIGFIEGLRDRLGCSATIVDFSNEPSLRRRGQLTRKKDAKLIVEHARREHRVDLFVRITDGDTSQPQKTVREEVARYPQEVHSMFICGVCDRDIEHWMCLDVGYAAQQLGFKPDQLPSDRQTRSDFIKSRVKQSRANDQTYAEFVADYVRNAPPATIRAWLNNSAFSAFYDECGRMAAQHDCPVKNER